MSAHKALQTSALKIVYDNFADCDYNFGAKIISDVMIMWTSKLVQCPYNYLKELDEFTFSGKAREEKLVWDIIGKWSHQYWEYYDQVKDMKSERFAYPSFTLDTPKAKIKAEFIRREILNALELLNQDSGIRFMSILIVEWARRFNTDGFLQMIHELGHSPTKESIADGSYVIVSVLWFMDMMFQLA